MCYPLTVKRHSACRIWVSGVDLEVDLEVELKIGFDMNCELAFE